MGATEFDPIIHGFAFSNSFDNPVVTIDFAGKHLELKTGGRCGGMSYLALDYFVNGIQLPTCKRGDFSPSSMANPQDSTWLADTCMKRLMQSWSDCLGKWLSYFLPMIVSGFMNDTRDTLLEKFITGAAIAGFNIPTPLNLAVARGYQIKDTALNCNKGELATVKSVVTKTSPRPLGMVAKADITAAAEAHYVVAFDTIDLGSKFGIKIWDCNFPGQTMVLVMDPNNPTSIEEHENTDSGALKETWAGFFVDESYRDVFPEKMSGVAYVDLGATVTVPDTVKKGADLLVKVDLNNGSDFDAHLQELRVVSDAGTKTLAPTSSTIAKGGATQSMSVTIPAFSSASGLKFISVRGVATGATVPGWPLPTTGKRGENAVIPVTVID